MNLHVILPLLLKLGLTLLLSLLALFGAIAQNVPAGNRKIHIKMLKDVNGKTVVLDTTITAADDAELARAIKGIKADTAILRALKNTRISIERATTVEGKQREAMMLSARSLVAADSAMQKALKNATVKIYRLDSTMVSADMKALFERIKTLEHDTAFIRMGKPLQLEISNMPRMENVIIFRKSDSLSLNNPGRSFRITGSPDSLLLHRLRGAEHLQLDPSKIDRIIVHKMKPGTATDTLTVKLHAEHLKIFTDKESGHKKVIRIDEAGNAQDIESFNPGNTSFSRTIFIVNSSIEEITAEDKKALKAAGAPVETSTKEELRLEEVSYYPNPNQGRFNLSFTPAQKGNTHIRVLDLTGRVIFTEEVKKLEASYTREIDISKYGRGVYFLQVAQGKRYFTRKIVVQ